jgi:hypothetical protein
MMLTTNFKTFYENHIKTWALSVRGMIELLTALLIFLLVTAVGGFVAVIVTVIMWLGQNTKWRL